MKPAQDMARPTALAALCLVLVAGSAGAGETARQILDRRKALDDGVRHWTDRRQQLTFRIHGKGEPLVRDLDVSEKRYPGDERKTIVFFRSPPTVAGTGFLAFNHPGKVAEQWLYLPALARTRVISGVARKEKFVASDLTFRDLDILTDMGSWTETDAASSRRDDDLVDDVPCHVIDLVPKRDDIGYGKIALWLGRDDLVPRKLEFHDERDGVAVKRITQAEVRPIGAIPVAHRMKVETLPAGTWTDVTVGETTFDSKLGDERFTQSALEQGPQ
jgi:hypothetical protein